MANGLPLSLTSRGIEVTERSLAAAIHTVESFEESFIFDSCGRFGSNELGGNRIEGLVLRASSHEVESIFRNGK